MQGNLYTCWNCVITWADGRLHICEPKIICWNIILNLLQDFFLQSFSKNLSLVDLTTISFFLLSFSWDTPHTRQKIFSGWYSPSEKPSCCSNWWYPAWSELPPSHLWGVTAVSPHHWHQLLDGLFHDWGETLHCGRSSVGKGEKLIPCCARLWGTDSV